VTSSDDCYNYASNIYPGAPEVCDYIDNNCVDGTNDEARTVSYSLDKDFDGWCQEGAIMGCPGLAPDWDAIPSDTCQQLIAPPTFVSVDCNDDNSQATWFCGEGLQTISETFTLGGGLFGAVSYNPFAFDCGLGWHLTRCEAVKTSKDGNVSISYCPLGSRRGEIDVRLGISALLSVSGYGEAFCTADASYP